jgi:hypothetical protein
MDIVPLSAIPVVKSIVNVPEIGTTSPGQPALHVPVAVTLNVAMLSAARAEITPGPVKARKVTTITKNPTTSLGFVFPFPDSTMRVFSFTGTPLGRTLAKRPDECLQALFWRHQSCTKSR